MDIKQLISQMDIEEKAALLTGAANMSTAQIERLGVAGKSLADGPHGVRSDVKGSNCTCYPSMCTLGATWNKELAEEVGVSLGQDCIHQGIDMILGPGINVKRNILCGRNFEYVAEDPVLAGEIGAAYIRGVESTSVATSLKHFAANSQETYRTLTSAEIDERTLREIYLKGFEIAVKKGKPTSVMCAYNKINAIWCSENKYLLTDVLRDDWNFDGFVVSDWGAVHDECKAIMAGLDLQMPSNANIVERVKEGLASGAVTEQAIDGAVERILRFVTRERPTEKDYSRQKQHELVQRAAAEGICLLKNDAGLLPLDGKMCKKIAVIGQFAVKPFINGQGSAEVHTDADWIDSPLEQLRGMMPDTQIDYIDCFKANASPDNMLWPMYGRWFSGIAEYDAVLFFAGYQAALDTECTDRHDAYLPPFMEMMISRVSEMTDKVIVVLQNGGALVKSDWSDRVGTIVETWLGGEGGGKAIADVLTGAVSPSGKLPETFPTRLRSDMDLHGSSSVLEYSEKWAVGYRYYDLHPEQIWFPFGHGLSYSEFEYSDLQVELDGHKINIAFAVKNIGKTAASETAQIYISDPVSAVSKPVKELKGFEKVSLAPGEKKTVSVNLTADDIAYYNIMLHRWVAESGRYDVLVGASSQDIRLSAWFTYEDPSCYTITRVGRDMLG